MPAAKSTNKSLTALRLRNLKPGETVSDTEKNWGAAGDAQQDRPPVSVPLQPK